MQEVNPNKPKSNNKNYNELKILLVIGAIVLLTMLIAIIQFGSSEQPAIASDADLLVREDSRTLGPDDAAVTFIEFLDPECFACGAAHSDVLAILDDYDGQIRFVIRYFPNHANSEMAIAATEAAGEQGMYWEMLDLLFIRQSEWVERATPQTDQFIAYAQELGLDMEEFMRDLHNPAYLELAERDFQDASLLNLRGTPVFFVNGQLVYGMQDRVIREMIDEILQAQ